MTLIQEEKLHVMKMIRTLKESNWKSYVERLIAGKKNIWNTFYLCVCSGISQGPDGIFTMEK